MKSILTRNDKILIALLIAAALLSAVPVVAALGMRAPGARAEVFVSGKRVATLSLASARKVSVRTEVGAETLQVARGRIRVASARCPRKVCSHSGWISQAGEELVCVPGERVVRIAGGGEPGVDAVSR